jgi:hypothetical protein
VTPSFGEAAMSAASQLTKQYVVGWFSKGAQSSLKPLTHSPLTAQQSESLAQVCVQ